MGDLHLESLSITGFRAFKELHLERLGRVNLITGRNSIGKSCVLDALQLFAARGALPVAVDQLIARNEMPRPVVVIDVDTDATALTERIEAFRNLFHAWPELSEDTALQVGDGANTLACWVGWPTTPAHTKKPLMRAELGEVPQWLASFNGGLRFDRLDMYFTSPTVRRRTPIDQVPGLRYVMLPPGGFDAARLGALWDDVALEPAGERVMTALSLVQPAVQRLNFRGDGPLREPEVKVEGLSRPVPLATLGEGALRVLGLALAAVCARDGVLLIDEFASGLHYSIHDRLWRMVIDVARDLNVQVFATTHSWDCIEGFELAARKHDEGTALLHRLQAKGGLLRVSTLGPDRLATVTREGIEVR